MLTLTALPAGNRATISQLHASPELSQRLNALGLRIGQAIEIIRRAPWHGPLQIRVGTTDLIMRESDAHCIHVTPQR